MSGVTGANTLQRALTLRPAENRESPPGPAPAVDPPAVTASADSRRQPDDPGLPRTLLAVRPPQIATGNNAFAHLAGGPTSRDPALRPSPEEIQERADELDERFQKLFAGGPDRAEPLVNDNLLLQFRLLLANGNTGSFFSDVRGDLTRGESDARRLLADPNAPATERAAARQRLDAIGKAREALPSLEKESARVATDVAANGPNEERWSRAPGPHHTAEARAFFTHLERQGARVPANQRDLVFAALRLGPRRVRTREELDAVIRGATADPAAGSLAVRLLRHAGYAHPERIESIHGRTGVAFLGYDEQQLARFERMWTSGPHAHFLNNAGKPRQRWLHDVQTVMAPPRAGSDGPPRYKYSAVNKSIVMPPMRSPEEERVFLHELGHGVERTHLFTSTGNTRTGDRWLRGSWSRDGNTPVGRNFADSNGDGVVTTADPNGSGEPERDYSTINASEDFAEAFSFWVTADAAGRRRLRRQLGPVKSRILEQLLGR